MGYVGRMSSGRAKRKSKRGEGKEPRPRFAPSAFLSGSPEEVQQLCEELAGLAAARFGDLAGTSWEVVGESLASQLRALGHDLSSFDDAEGFQEWQASWHHARGAFTFMLVFRAPCSVEVTWKTDAATFTARR
jgi:hypothetical protein